eukprot:GHVU01119555.1.p1 GENE.GHVU01119555.1~~GHVU01119555.1.p1  ORF type:complete len:107 (-),score=6.68 GHVU01119555.1:71-391(-)
MHRQCIDDDNEKKNITRRTGRPPATAAAVLGAVRGTLTHHISYLYIVIGLPLIMLLLHSTVACVRACMQACLHARTHARTAGGSSGSLTATQLTYPFPSHPCPLTH